MTTFLLVHGAFRGGWAWGRVSALLRARGHHVVAPSLLGCGELAGDESSVPSLVDWVNQLAHLLEMEDLRDVVLVAHSQAGIVVPGLLSRSGGRISRTVLLDAAVPEAGECAVELFGPVAEWPARELRVPFRAVEAGEEYDAATAHWVNERLRPTPVAPSLDAVGAMPSGAVVETWFCERTPQGYPSTITRARLDAAGLDYRVIDAFHDAPISAPELVHALLTGSEG